MAAPFPFRVSLVVVRAGTHAAVWVCDRVADAAQGVAVWFYVRVALNASDDGGNDDA